MRARFALAVLIVSGSLAAFAWADRDGRTPPANASFEAGRKHAGEELDCDLPAALHMKNIGSKIDGYGMCVMSAIEMAAINQGLEKYRGLRDWAAAKPGGAFPRKVDEQLAEFCAAKGLPAPRYLQYEGPDPGPVMLAAAKSGRIACITYGFSPRYERSANASNYIAHMVNCVKHGSGQYAVVLDNNFPGVDRYEWMSQAEIVRRSRLKTNGREGNAWIFVWTEGFPYPPSPRNPTN